MSRISNDYVTGGDIVASIYDMLVLLDFISKRTFREITISEFLKLKLCVIIDMYS